MRSEWPYYGQSIFDAILFHDRQKNFVVQFETISSKQTRHFPLLNKKKSIENTNVV